MTSSLDSEELEVEPNQIKDIPVIVSGTGIFHNNYAVMTDQFRQEMKQIDKHMDLFSSNMTQLYGDKAQITNAELSVLKRSPLLVNEGQGKCLKLQFDVNQFQADEIKVKLLNDMLIITASHLEETADSRVYQKFDKQFRMPPDTDPDTVTCSLSTDGVLTVLAPLPPNIF